MRLLLALLLCWSVGAWGATYYVDSAAAGGGDGSLATPWNAFSGITGLAAGDRVCISGSFDETLTPATTGTSGAAEVEYDFACAGVGAGSIRRTGNNHGVSITGAIQYIHLAHPDISAGGRCVNYAQTTPTTQGHHRITGGQIFNCSTDAGAGTSPSVFASVHNLVIDGTAIYNSGDDLIRAPANVGDIVIRNATLFGADQRSGSGDLVQVGTSGGAGNLTIEDSTLTYEVTDKQGVLDSGTGTLILRRNRFNGDGTGSEAIGANKTGGTCTIEQNEFHDWPTFTIFADGASVGCTVRANTFIDSASNVYLKSDATGTWALQHNTAVRSATFLNALGTQTVASTNNLIGCTPATFCVRKGTAVTYTGTTNQFTTEYAGMFQHSSTLYDTLSAWSAAQSVDATSVVDDPEFVGGDSPTTATDFRLRASSPACGAGTYIPGSRDFDDLPMGYPTDIGAFRCPGTDSPAPSYSGSFDGLFTWLIGLAGLMGLGHMMRGRHVSV